MSIKLISLRVLQRMAIAVTVTIPLLTTFTFAVQASPGAHGPNGEHLDTKNQVPVSLTPKFEGLTETFELLGELKDSQLVVYLHDFKSNTPVSNATIEMESGGLSAIASYSTQLGAYVITGDKLLARLQGAGEHELVFTIMTEDSGDLLASTLVTSALDAQNTEHAQTQHHHFPWWAVLLTAVVFFFGFLLGRYKKESK